MVSSTRLTIQVSMSHLTQRIGAPGVRLGASRRLAGRTKPIVNGHWKFEFMVPSGTMVRECACGNQLFYLPTEGHMRAVVDCINGIEKARALPLPGR